MKTFAVLAVAALAFVLPASARIGETKEQCVARYGKAETLKDDSLMFTRAELSIIVEFYEGKADLVMFSKLSENTIDKEISNDEIQLILKANGGDAVWKPWKQSNFSINY